MFNKHVHNIIEILKKEYNYYKDILELAKTKKDIIVTGKVAELDKIVKLEQNMIFDIGQLEKAREKEVEGICMTLGVKPRELVISELLDKLQPNMKNEMERLQSLLNNTLEDLKKMNDLNGQLIKQSLEYIDYSINIITTTGVANSSLYEDMTEKGKTMINNKRIFDTKV